MSVKVVKNYPLSTDDRPGIKQLWENLHPRLTPYWKDFCIAVNFDDYGATLKLIREEFNDKPTDCFTEVLTKWLERDRPTWREVIECLKHTSCNQLAKELEERFGAHSGIIGENRERKHDQLQQTNSVCIPCYSFRKCGTFISHKSNCSCGAKKDGRYGNIQAKPNLTSLSI